MNSKLVFLSVAFLLLPILVCSPSAEEAFLLTKAFSNWLGTVEDTTIESLQESRAILLKTNHYSSKSHDVLIIFSEFLIKSYDYYLHALNLVKLSTPDRPEYKEGISMIKSMKNAAEEFIEILRTSLEDRSDPLHQFFADNQNLAAFILKMQVICESFDLMLNNQYMLAARFDLTEEEEFEEAIRRSISDFK